MNYQVFARKWRPKKFEDIIGQEYVITAIKHSFNLNKIHHAYILSGTRGTGKTTIARLFAKGLNCETSVTINMCGVCQNCKDIDLGCFIDLIEIDAASRTKVEDTYEFLEGVQYAPVQGRFKVYLIDEIHMLSKHSFNALLKILEEPPKHVKFILITTEYQKIPETVLSRCLQFYLKPLSVSQITSKLAHICNIEQITIVSTNVLELLAYSAKGSMRDALNLLEQATLLGNNSITDDVINNMLGLLDIEESLSLVENLVDRNLDDIMRQIGHYSDLGVNWDFIFEKILTIFQKSAIYQFSLNSSLKTVNMEKTKCFEERIYNLSKRITPDHIQLYYQIFLLGRRELPYAPSYRMGMEMTILRALAFCPTNNTHAIKKNQNEIDSVLSDNMNLNFVHDNLLKDEHKNDLKPQKSTNNINNTSLTSKQFGNDIHSKNLPYDFDHIPCNTVTSIDSDSKNIITHDITAKILKVRSKLLDYKKHHNILNHNLITADKNKKSQKISTDVLKRFSNINADIANNNVNNVKKK